MFLGSIPQAMRNIVSAIVKSWAVDSVHVGCSGNFTVERVLAELGVSNIYGCDVTIYSCAIGAYLSQQPFPIAVKEPFQDCLGWFEPYIQTPAAAVATLQLCSELFKGLDKEGAWKVNPYYTRIRKGYETQWSDLFEKTLAKVEALPFSMAGFYSGDAAHYVQGVPEGHGFISYPPFWAGGYEDMWDKLDLIFEWERPDYKVMDAEGVSHYIAAITQRSYWAFGVPELRDEFASNLAGVAHTTNRGVPIHMYASHGPHKIVMPKQGLIPVSAPRLLPGMALGDRIVLAPLSAGQFGSLRSLYMNPNIAPAAPEAAFAVIVGGVIIGAYALTDHSQSFAKNQRMIYLLSDFPVAPTDYPRLAKLVLYAVLSTESQQLAERVARRRIREVFTTAFTDNPVSMKYRGLFTVSSRKELADGASSRYAVNYVALAGQWTLCEGLDLWKRKHGVFADGAH